MRSRRLPPLLFLVLIRVPLTWASAQDIHVTFSASGAASSIDSIRATNLTNGQSIVMPGDQTLTLREGYTGIDQHPFGKNQIQIYPNPCDGTAHVTFWNPSDQEVTLTINDMQGRCIDAVKQMLYSGEHRFRFQLPYTGLYLIQISGHEINLTTKVLSMVSSEEIGMVYCGKTSGIMGNPLFKSSPQTEYLLGYEPGEVVLYRCMSDIYTTLVTDTPEADKQYDVEFVLCQDPDEKNYSVVKIGEQTWMAENLAYLPTVDSATLSDNESRFYVYGYFGYNVDESKSTDNFNTYGVLYSWKAANVSCPSGWHLPDDSTWNIMISHFDEPVGGKLKETGLSHWKHPNTGATNSSGFSAMPGGGKGWNNGYYWGLSQFGTFWSSSYRGPGYFGPIASVICLETGSDRLDPAGWTVSTVSQGYSVRCIKDN